jgi:hypothetical protein
MLLLLLFLSYVAFANALLDCINTDGIEKKRGNENAGCYCGENEDTYCLNSDDYCKVDAETNRGECFSCYRGKQVVIIPPEKHNGVNMGPSTSVCRDCAQSVRYFFFYKTKYLYYLYIIYIELTFFSYNCFP